MSALPAAVATDCSTVNKDSRLIDPIRAAATPSLLKMVGDCNSVILLITHKLRDSPAVFAGDFC